MKTYKDSGKKKVSAKKQMITKKNHTKTLELKNTIAKTENKWVNSTAGWRQRKISELEDATREITQIEQQRKII